MTKKLIAILALVAGLVGGIIGVSLIPPVAHQNIKLGGTVENFPVIFTNGLSVGKNNNLVIDGSGNFAYTGNYVLTGAAGSTITIGTGVTTGSIVNGAALTTGTATIGGTATTGALTFGRYSGASASTINIANGATTGAETINIGSAATSTGSSIITIGSNVTTAGTGTKIKGVSTVFHPTIAVPVSSSATATASQLLNGAIFIVSGTTSTITTDTAANIALAMPGGVAAAGDAFSFEVANGGSGNATLAGGSSVTLAAGITTTIATGVTRIVTCEFTSASAATCY